MALTKSGEILKVKRLEKKLSFEEVEKETKIRMKFLRALEEGDLTLFHSTAYARGFLKNYAEFLELDTKLILALFRRETTLQKLKVIPQGMVEKNSPLRITPTRAALLVVFFILMAVSYYLFQQYRGFLAAPALTLEKPKEQQLVAEGEIEVTGKTDIDATILVNSQPAVLEESGRFSIKINVFAGETTITVVAKNRRGKETVITRKIKVE
ncbi:helix-turn-helix domain-containing protein [Candidatus Microgenomates bacterium]|nr:helix-turn-helix domain-containing protein [Candidatus Microgenomates bacterium]